jgi:hypothetical protein
MGEIPAEGGHEQPAEELTVPEVSKEGLGIILDYWANELTEVKRLESTGEQMEGLIAYKCHEVHAEIERTIWVLDQVIPISTERSWGDVINELAARQQDTDTSSA